MINGNVREITTKIGLPIRAVTIDDNQDFAVTFLFKFLIQRSSGCKI